MKNQVQLILSILIINLIRQNVYAFQNKYCQLTCDYIIKSFEHTVCDREAQVIISKLLFTAKFIFIYCDIITLGILINYY